MTKIMTINQEGVLTEIKTVPVYCFRNGLYREVVEGEDLSGTVVGTAEDVHPDHKGKIKTPIVLRHLPRDGKFTAMVTCLDTIRGKPSVRTVAEALRQGPTVVEAQLCRGWGSATFDLDMSTVRMKQGASKTWSFKSQPDYGRIWREAQPAEIVRVTTTVAGPASESYLCGTSGSPEPFHAWTLDGAKELVKRMKNCKTTVEVIQ